MMIAKLSVNLATHPLRNRRLFYFLFGCAVVALAVISFVAGEVFFTYRAKAKDTGAKIAELEQKMRADQRNESDIIKKVEAEIKVSKGTVDSINGIILRKSFSWIGFLANLENALPQSSYIVSLAPILVGDSSLEVRFKVVSQSLGDLLKLIDNLRALKFKVMVEGESQDQRGLIVSEISFKYERNV